MTKDNKQARSRQEQRKKRRREAMVRRAGAPQIQPAEGFTLPNIQLPVWWRNIFVFPIAVGLVGAVFVISALINPLDETRNPNGIWLDERWTHQSRGDDELITLSNQLRDHAMGTLFVYTSSLRSNNVWSGNPTERNIFSEVESNIRNFVQRWRQISPDTQLYAWVEVTSTATEGYRLDSPQVQEIIAQYSRLMIEEYGFDGILLDIKPIFDGNQDFLTLIRQVRTQVGLDTPIAVTMPPDFTPVDAGIVVPEVIAPGTVFSEEYKQRVALQVDLLVVIAFNSYLTNPVDYIEWVRYQVQAFSSAMSGIDSGAQLLIGIPNYADNQPAHSASIESIAGGLDGMGRGYNSLDDEQKALVQGIALFTDRDLTNDDWQLVREKWLMLD